MNIHGPRPGSKGQCFIKKKKKKRGGVQDESRTILKQKSISSQVCFGFENYRNSVYRRHFASSPVSLLISSSVVVHCVQNLEKGLLLNRCLIPGQAVLL